MIIDRYHFHFFGKREITSLYFTLALIHFGEGLISIFVPIYFWQLNYPLWKIIFFYFLQASYFVALTLCFLPLIKKLSDKMMIFLSIPFTILYFSGLGLVDNQPSFFYILPALLAIGMMLFNVGYHLKFSGAVDGDHIGKEVGLRYMFASLTQLASPFVGGVIISIFGFQNTFLVGSAILILAVIPLFFFPERNLSSNLHLENLKEFILNKTLWPFTLSGFGFATEKMVEIIVWPIAMFLAIGSIQNFGGLVSIGLLAGATITYLVGLLSDTGQRRQVLKGSTALLSLIWLARIFLARPFAIAASHIADNIARSAVMTTWSSQYYKITRAVADPSLFILSREILYNASRILFLPVLMMFAYLMSRNDFFTTSFILAALLALFYIFANKFHTSRIGSPEN